MLPFDGASASRGAARESATNASSAGRTRRIVHYLIDRSSMSKSSVDLGRDGAAHAAVTVREIRRDGELAASADLHADEPGIPALDDVALADLEA